MPRVRLSGSEKPPEGWDLISPPLLEFERQMREIENEPHEGKRKCEATWPIFKLHHQRSRYIYECYYKRKAISRELYDYCVREGWADARLIAKWRKEGFERLCCLRCIQTSSTNFGTTCICRVPKHELPPDKRVVQCIHCGCGGCASGD
ncbi:protein BUD31 homolog [Cyclospora cayetanensis]|uniref:Protein BUD31 homolog n=1 Tax=Cyclospora cayetanensis TaxID=88456 RepID=A0A6P6RZ43_9EIME|nr:protein BUD31 homolog [Cyclospora cayetanensis]